MPFKIPCWPGRLDIVALPNSVSTTAPLVRIWRRFKSLEEGLLSNFKTLTLEAVSYTHLTLPTTPYV